MRGSSFLIMDEKRTDSGPRREASGADAVERLSGELRRLLRPGAEPASIAGLTRLCSLDVVAAGVEGGHALDAALVARDLLRDACAALGEPASVRASQVLFGLLGEWRGRSLAERRRGAAEVLATTPEGVRKHREGRLLRALAWEVLDLDRRHRRTQVAACAAGDSRVAARWFDLHLVYGRVFTPAWGVGSDLVGWLEMRAVSSPRQSLYRESSLWWYAQLLVTIREHILDGGLWMLADRDAETEVAEIVWLWQVLPPFDEAGNSWLRMTIDAIPGWEFLPFAERLRGDEGARVLERWEGWLGSCACSLDAPAAECEVHRVIACCELFATHIEEDWNRVADWYDKALADPLGMRMEDVVARFWQEARRRIAANAPLLPSEIAAWRALGER